TDTHGNGNDIGYEDSLRREQVTHQADERRATVIAPKQLYELRLCHGAGRHGVDRRENAAVHRDEVRREDHLHRLAGDVAEGLLDLRRMAVLPDVISRDALVALGEVRAELGRPARAGHAALTINDDRPQLDVLARHQW